MKKLKYLFIMALPVILLSCGNQGGERDKSNDQNRNRSNAPRDTVSRGSMFPFQLGNQSEDEDFVKKAAIGGMMEVELGQYATENAQSDRVKKFGEMMVRDHKKGNEELKSVASSKNIELPSSMDNKHQEMVEDLKKEQGDDFDKAYIKKMVEDHQEDVDEFRKEAENGKDSSIREFAAKTLPVLEMHLDSAKSIRDDMK